MAAAYPKKTASWYSFRQKSVEKAVFGVVAGLSAAAENKMPLGDEALRLALVQGILFSAYATIPAAKKPTFHSAERSSTTTY